jgi:hypothetical protein
MYLFRQWRYFAHSLPANFVVYDDDPTEAQRLRATDPRFVAVEPLWDGVVKPHAGAAAGFWSAASEQLRTNYCTVMSHYRTTPAGERRVVAVFVGMPYRDRRLVWLHSAQYAPASWTGNAQVTRLDLGHDDSFSFGLKPTDRLRLFAGQPDPKNPSRFTIGYELNGVPGTIEGTFGQNGGVELKTTSGAKSITGGKSEKRSQRPIAEPGTGHS